jgi:mitotic spindle assembly checkpoint protein MAD2
VASGQTLERWTFSVETKRPPAGQTAVEKPLADIQAEIRAIIRQITASVTFLPLIEEPCSFDLLVYADASVSVPAAWEESDPRYIATSQEVRLRSFSTKIHRVDAAVSYRVTD